MRKCPHCEKPAPYGSRGNRQRKCAHCRNWLLPVSEKQAATIRRSQAIPPICRTLISVLSALEDAPIDRRYAVLSDYQEQVLKDFLREIVGYVRSRDRQGLQRPRAYRFDGGRVLLRYTTVGALHIYSSKTRRPLAATYPEKLW